MRTTVLNIAHQPEENRTVLITQMIITLLSQCLFALPVYAMQWRSYRILMAVYVVDRDDDGDSVFCRLAAPFLF